MADHTTENTAASRDGRWLALIPLSVAAIMLVLMMPRETEPNDVPLPVIDMRVVSQVERDDTARAALAREKRLPDDALALGTAMRAFYAAQSKNDQNALSDARHALNESSSAFAVRRDSARDALVLRAVMTEEFIAALAAWEKTGEDTKDLEELGGVGFVRSLASTGWSHDRHIDLDESTRRVMFKTVWNGIAGFERTSELALSLDEERVLYSLYLSRPHPAEPDRQNLDAERAAATTDVECEKAGQAERRATERWRLEKIKKLAEIDPKYPGTYALGVGLYRSGRYEQSVDAFRLWIEKHPEGTLGLRARNHLKAAVAKVNGY